MTIIIKTVMVTYFIGANGERFDSEAAAIRSLLRERIAQCLGSVSYSRSYDTDEGADAIIANLDDIEILMQQYKAAL